MKTYFGLKIDYKLCTALEIVRVETSTGVKIINFAELYLCLLSRNAELTFTNCNCESLFLAISMIFLPSLLGHFKRPGGPGSNGSYF